MADINLNAQESASQCKQIARYMEEGHRITQLDALRLFGCFRLASRIHDLRNQGYIIEKRTVVTNTGKKVCEYWIDKNQASQ